MLTTRLVSSVAEIAILVMAAGIAFGQDYPSKPIRIVTTNAGGGNDVVARIITPPLSSPLGQPVIVDNRAGNAAEIVSLARPDGYTLLLEGGFAVESLLRKAPFDPVADFSPITLVSKEPNVLVVHPSLPARSVKDLIALAKAKPGELNWGSSTTGGSSHLSGELFKALTGVNIVRVPYKGGGLLATALIGGEVKFSLSGAAGVVTHIKSGKLIALAVTSAQPSAMFPDLPPIAASVPGYESVSINAVFAPAKTPEAIIRRLNQEILRVLNTQDVKEKLVNVGVDPAPSSPEQAAAHVKGDMSKWGKIIKDAGIKVD